MVNYSLLVSPAARQDLQKLYLYGVLNWGAEQGLDYLARFKAALFQLRKSPKTGIERHDILKSLYVMPVEKHYILYQIQENKIEVLRILHIRLDPQKV